MSERKLRPPKDHGRSRMRRLVCGRGSRLCSGAGGRVFPGEDADEAALAAFVLEEHHTVDEREKRIVFGARHVLAGLVTRAALADQDTAAGDGLAAEALDAKPLAVRI